MPLLGKVVRVKKNGLGAILNWHDRGFVGITYTDGDLNGMSALLDEEDVELPADEPPTRIDLSSLSPEELREFLIAIRHARREPPPTKPTRAKKEKKVKDDGENNENNENSEIGEVITDDVNVDIEDGQVTLFENGKKKSSRKRRVKKEQKFPDEDRMIRDLKALPPDKAKALIEAALKAAKYGGGDNK